MFFTFHGSTQSTRIKMPYAHALGISVLYDVEDGFSSVGPQRKEKCVHRDVSARAGSHHLPPPYIEGGSIKSLVIAFQMVRRVRTYVIQDSVCTRPRSHPRSVRLMFAIHRPKPNSEEWPIGAVSIAMSWPSRYRVR